MGRFEVLALFFSFIVGLTPPSAAYCLDVKD